MWRKENIIEYTPKFYHGLMANNPMNNPRIVHVLDLVLDVYSIPTLHQLLLKYLDI